MWNLCRGDAGEALCDYLSKNRHDAVLLFDVISSAVSAAEQRPPLRNTDSSKNARKFGMMLLLFLFNLIVFFSCEGFQPNLTKYRSRWSLIW